MIGPFTFLFNNKSYTIFIILSSNKNANVRLKCGCLYVTIPYVKSFFLKHNFKNEIENNIVSDSLYKDLYKYLSNLFIKLDLFNKYNKAGYDLYGQLPYCNEKVYILGNCLKVTSDISYYGNKDYFIGKDLDSVKKNYFILAENYFKKRVEELKTLMGIDVEFKIKITDFKTYNGINNISKNILGFDVSLYGFYQEVSDAIVIHELAHYFEHNHSSRFYAIVYKYCPNYKNLIKIITSGQFLRKYY